MIMERLIYYTDKVTGDNYTLYLDNVGEVEYFLDGNGFLWLSRNAGEILLYTVGSHIGFNKDFSFIKRQLDNINR